jgi:hypothetical protein
VADYVLHEARREEQEAIDPAFDRSLDLLPRIASGRLNDATTWLHTTPKSASAPDVVIPAKAGTQSPDPEKKP